MNIKVKILVRRVIKGKLKKARFYAAFRVSQTPNYLHNRKETLKMTEDRKEYLYKYQKEKLKRVPLDLPINDYKILAETAAAAEMSINGYIKMAISEKIEREKQK